MKTFYPLLTWVEAAEAAAAGRVALLPIGTVDANGPQIPMGFDYLVSAALAEQAADRTGDVWLPPLAYGVSEALSGFPGTIAMPPDKLGEQVEAVVRSLVKGGFGHVLLITNHGPNQFPVEYACRRIRRDTGVLVASVNPARLATDLAGDLFAGPAPSIGHGAEPGTSLLMHLHPSAVRTDLASRREKSAFQGLEVLTPTDVRFGDSQVNVFLELEEVSPTAGWSDPSRASAEKGAVLFGRMTDYLVDFLGTYRKLDTRAVPPEVQR
ncbi:creatininase family protein [Amycolatopsis jejuensis]|uniref:creatininase family protein n=1 Tax=Amycolatopsis jejuensis TaxID=330084 RepID=UPI0005241369|nr:creatininase family protein [Amycolatopsis jejuensis]